MDAPKIDSPMKTYSPSGLLTILVAVGIIFIGIREFFYPGTAAHAFGVPLLEPGDSDLLAIKASRDVASGILAFTLLGLRKRKVLAYAMGVLTLIPIFDGLIVLRHAAWAFTAFTLVHWGTAAFMLVIVELLRRGK